MSRQEETEEYHQRKLFEWRSFYVRYAPELRWLHHIPNGGARGGDARSRAIRGASMKGQGVTKGVFDVFLPVQRGTYCGLYIELKRPSLRPKTDKGRGGLSSEQTAFRDFVMSQKYHAEVCYSWEEATKTILWYLIL